MAMVLRIYEKNSGIWIYENSNGTSVYEKHSGILGVWKW